MMQILRAKKFKMKTAMSKKKRLGSELEKEEAMEKYLEVKFAEEELQKELDEAKSDSDSEVKWPSPVYINLGDWKILSEW